MINEKPGKLTKKQSKFIQMFINDCHIKDIISHLEITEQDVTYWIISQGIFVSSLNSAIYLRALSIHTYQINLKYKALEQLDRLLMTGDINAIKMAMKLKEPDPEFNADKFSPTKINQDRIIDFFESIEEDLNLPPWQRFRRGGSDDSPF